jgi:hypothetical protein
VQRDGNGEAWSGKLIPWKGIVERAGIVHVQPERATLYPIAEDQTKPLWDIFRCAAHMKMWLSYVDDFAGKKPRVKVYGDPVPGPDASAVTEVAN